LLRAYAASYQAGALGIPYMKVSDIGYPARENFEVVISNVKADLAEAKMLMQVTSADKTRISNRTIVAAIQARAALYEKNWSDAVTYSSEVTAAVPLAPKHSFRVFELMLTTVK
jgi:hypothetical protein